MSKALAIHAVLCLFAVLSTSGARLPLQVSPAPAPATAAGSATPKADLLFVVSANQATFAAGNTLTLSNVSQTAQFTSNGGRSGIYPMGYFVNGSAFFAADGKWLDTPQAALYGSTVQGGNQTVVLLSLASPVYDPLKQTLAFTYAVVTPGKTPVKYTGGAVAQAEADSQNGVGIPVAGVVQDGGVLSGAALFIDQNQGALHPSAETKTWWWPWWGGGWGGGWGWNNGWNGWGWNGGWNNGWNGWGGSQQVVVINNGWGK